jgi:uracil-DNA glycosylase
MDPGCRMRPDNEQVVRRVVPRAAISPLLLVGQALGPDTQRRSGLPYTYPNGTLSPTGRALDQLLHRIGFTIEVKGTLPYAYSSDIVQRYPGRAAAGGGDRRPTLREVANCADWLTAELRIVRPRVILLLGTHAARHFFRSHGRSEPITWGEPYEVMIEGRCATALPVYHPAYRRWNPELVDRLYGQVARRVRRLLAGRDASAGA